MKHGPKTPRMVEPYATSGVSWGKVARLTGLEPATPGVTGRYSNQLSYNRVLRCLLCAACPVKRHWQRRILFSNHGAWRFS